jgi:hypothetical protein
LGLLTCACWVLSAVCCVHFCQRCGWSFDLCGLSLLWQLDDWVWWPPLKECKNSLNSQLNQKTGFAETKVTSALGLTLGDWCLWSTLSQSYQDFWQMVSHVFFAFWGLVPPYSRLNSFHAHTRLPACNAATVPTADAADPALCVCFCCCQNHH